MFHKKKKPIVLTHHTVEALNILQAVLKQFEHGLIAEVDIFPAGRGETEVWFYFYTSKDFEKAKAAGEKRPSDEEKWWAMVEFGQSVHLFRYHGLISRVYVFLDESGNYRFLV